MSDIPPPPPGMRPPSGGFPPSDYSQAPPKKTNRTLILVIILICIGVPCVGVVVAGVFAYRFWGNMKPTISCVTSIENIGKGVVEYAREHKGVLPKAETWQDDVRPYYQRRVSAEKAPFEMMPPTGDWTCEPSSKGGTSTGVAFNSNVSAKKLEDLENPDGTALVFEVPDIGRNLHRPYKRLPEESSPTFLGTRRGWIWVDASGTIHGMKTRNGFKIDDEKDSSSSSGSSGASDSSE